VTISLVAAADSRLAAVSISEQRRERGNDLSLHSSYSEVGRQAGDEADRLNADHWRWYCTHRRRLLLLTNSICV